VHVLVVADGDVPDGSALDATWPGWDAHVGLVIGADGGALRTDRIGRRPDIVVGDGDSLGPAAIERFRADGIEVRLVPAEKDQSDTELAVTTAIEVGATRLTVLGAFGGRRFDHALANVALLALPALGGRPIALLDERTRVRLLTGPASLDLEGRNGDVVSLLPFGADVEGVVTRGLQYPLRDETLEAGPARGLSNVRVGTAALVTARSGRLLVVESPATLPR
jgi:thiamine pyrophosphokinase